MGINLKDIASKAKLASYTLSSLSTDIKNKALLLIAKEIDKNRDLILKENELDLKESLKKIEEKNLSKSLYERLKLDNEKINVIIQGITDVANLEDPVNKTLWGMELNKGLELYRVSCPIGVIGVIFESRPDVVPQITSLAIKSSNAVILKGGNEAYNSNKILVDIINKALNKVKEIPSNSINLIKTRDDVKEMLKMNNYIDLIIPRGGNDLVKYIQSNTKIPVLGHSEGICHIYIDKYADKEKINKIIVDAKTQYPSACNSIETLLINKEISKEILPDLILSLNKYDVKIKGDNLTKKIVNDIENTTEEDWKTEYGDKILSIKIVDNLNEAINHINKYGSGHTDSIITENKENANVFMDLIDSANVYLNASTRFADGFRYGLGAEVGISTNKTHSRGPVGLEGLVIYKYKLYGNGDIVSEYSGENAKKYTHKRLI